jgi:sugar fermentation stimulation protein A
MRFSGPLLRGTLRRRYKRFFADVVLDDGETSSRIVPIRDRC